MKVAGLEALGFTRAEILAHVMGGGSAPVASPTVSDQFAPYIGKWCIVRGYGSGVHAGQVTHIGPSSDGRICVSVAPGSVRLWRWVAGGNGKTLSAVASHGLAAGSKTEAATGASVIPDCCELIEISDPALASIRAVVWG